MSDVALKDSFDDSLNALVTQMERRLPDDKSEYAKWEKENYERQCASMLREMTERVERLMIIHKDYKFITEERYCEVCAFLESQMPRFDIGGRMLSMMLVEALGKLADVPEKSDYGMAEVVTLMRNYKRKGCGVVFDTSEERDTIEKKIVKANFRCKWGEKDMFRVNNLYQELKEEEWIAENTDDVAFRTLFGGGEGLFTITWTGQKRDLRYLFLRLKEEKVIWCPVGVGHWQIVSSKFVGKNGERFTDLNKGEEPKKNREKIEDMVRRMAE